MKRLRSRASFLRSMKYIDVRLECVKRISKDLGGGAGVGDEGERE